MKKKFLKTFLLASAMLLVFGTGVYAGSYLEPISAYINKGITLTWNDVPFYPTEADGTRVYPITYNGRTYIPAKFVAEKAGLILTWEDSTMTVGFKTYDYTPQVLDKGTYKKIGNGTIEFLTDDFESITQYGYNIEETLATSNSGTHLVKMSKVSGTLEEKKQAHINYVESMEAIVTGRQWKIDSKIALGGGHNKIVAIHEVQPLEMTLYSTDTEIIFSTRRTDMGTQTIQPTVTTTTKYFDGYFSSVPKPNLDSTWTEEVLTGLKDWSVGNNKSYTLSEKFSTDSSKIDTKFKEYQNTLISNGFSLYETSYEHYTYTKGDIAIKIFAGYDNITVDLYSGYQAPHVEF